MAGLNSFLKSDWPNLMTCDVICHGVPSPGVFRFYIRQLQTKAHSRITGYRFRTKPSGWKNYFTQIEFGNGKSISEPFASNAYMKGFLADLYLRPTCHSCKYSRLPRVADITLGDFWGIWNFRPDWDTNEGITAVLLNSEKAVEHISNIDLEKKKAELAWVIAGNPALQNSVMPHKKRNLFFKLYKKDMNFECIIEKCLPPPTYLDKILWSVRRRIQKYGKKQRQ